VCVFARLSADAKFRNDFLVSIKVFYFQVVKKLSSFADQKLAQTLQDLQRPLFGHS
jgi:hypothetical protein